MDTSSVEHYSAGVKRFMRAIAMVLVQPFIHDIPQLGDLHRLVMIIQTLFLKHTDELLHKRLFLRGLRSGPILPDTRLVEIILGVLHVLSAVSLTTATPFPNRLRAFSRAVFGFPA
jgi:hypothetical protein